MDTRTPPGAARAGASGSPPSVTGRLGPYRLLQVIGGGGMGVVHLALDPAGRAVAIKVLRPHVAADPSARRRLAREVDALRRVRSPRVAEVLDADPDAEQPYVVTEFVPAPPLDAHVESVGPLAGAELGVLGLGLGDALAAIHAAGVVHRDLKPGNVLVADGEPVVIDFGIAQVADDVRLTSTGLVMGTPGYLAPEVLDGGDVSPAGDWWGWAAVVAFAATGHPPFGAGPTEGVLSRVRRGAADLSGVPAPLTDVLAAALDPDPAQRPAPRRLREAVQALADGTAEDAGAWPTRRTPASAAETTALTREDGAAAVVRRAEPQPTAEDGLPAAHYAQQRPDPRDARPTQHLEQPPPSPPWTPPGGTAVLPTGGASAVGAAPTAALPGAVQPVQQPARQPVHQPVHQQVQQLGPDAAPTTALPGPVPSAAPVPWAVPPPSTTDPGAPPQRLEGAHRAPGARPGRSGVLAALLAAVVATAAVAPTVAAIAVAAGVVLFRTVDRAAAGAARRRYERGPRRSDAAATAVRVPGHLLGAALASVPALLLPLAMAVSTAFLVGWALAPQGAPAPNQALPLAAGALVGAATAWWGPGGASVRRGARVGAAGALPSSTAAAVVTGILLLVALAAVIVTTSSGGSPDWTPLTGPPLTRA